MKFKSPLEEIVFAAGSATAGSKPKFASGTLLTTPEVGAYEFDGTSFYQTVETTSGRAQNVQEQIYRTTADGSAFGAGIADVFPATSSFPTVTNGIYVFEFYLNFLKTTAGTVTWALVNTQTYTNLVARMLMTNVAGIGGGASQILGIVATTSAGGAFGASPSLNSAVNHRHEIHALAECGTAGNIRLRATQSAGTITLLRGSYYTVRRLPAANVGIFVA